MSNYEDILESYWECKFQVTEVLSKELEEPIVIHSRVPNEPSFTVHSISSLRSLPPGVRLRINNSGYMRVSCSPGQVSSSIIVWSIAKFSRRRLVGGVSQFLASFLVVPVDCL